MSVQPPQARRILAEVAASLGFVITGHAPPPPACPACGSADLIFGPPEDPFVLCGTCGYHQSRTGGRS